MPGLLWIVILLVTGYLLTFFFFKKQDFLERVVCGLGLSISFLVLTGLLLNFYVINGFTVKLALFAGSLLTIMSLFVSKRYKLVDVPKFEVKKIIFLLSGVIVVFFLIYSPHFTYRFPLHVTEYFYMNHAYKITETGKLCINPYNDIYDCDAKTGFPALLASIFLLTKMDPLLDYKFLPALFGIITALVIFVFIYELTKNFWTSLLAMVLSATIPGNSLILGLILAVPFTVSLILCFLFLLLMHKWLTERSANYLILAGIFIFIAFTLHGSAAAYILVVSLPYVVYNMKKDWKVFCAFFIGLLAVSAAVFLSWFWKGGIKETILSNFWRLEFPYHNINYFLIGIPLAICGLFGLYIILGEKHQKILSFFFIFSLVGFLISSIIKYSYLIRPERLIYLVLLFAIFIGSIGFSHLLGILRHKIKKKYVFILIAGVLLALIFGFQLRANFPPLFDYIVDDKDYEMLDWLKIHYSGQRILANPRFSSAIPITNNSVVVHWMGGAELSGEADRFFESPSCEQGLDWVERYKPKLLISQKALDCVYLKEVQSNVTGYFIYEVKKEI